MVSGAPDRIRARHTNRSARVDPSRVAAYDGSSVAGRSNDEILLGSWRCFPRCYRADDKADSYVRRRTGAGLIRAPPRERDWTLIRTPMDPVSCVSCVSWRYPVNAAETHETFPSESGMRYQLQITTSGGPPPTTILHVVVFTEPHNSEPLCGTNPGAPRPLDAGPLATC
jgi:hypothetical protein